MPRLVLLLAVLAGIVAVATGSHLLFGLSCAAFLAAVLLPTSRRS